MSDVSSHGKRKSGRSLIIAGVLLIVMIVVFLSTLVSRQKTCLRDAAEARVAAINAGRPVSVVKAIRASGERPVVLLGEARPYTIVTLYAKVSGYLRDIKVDKGDHVEADQLLAIIESPELHRQYDAAVADAKNKRVDAVRSRGLLQSGAVSPQNFERMDTLAQVAEETAASILAQKDYEILRAPFTGTITARFADPGALVQSAATAQTSALPVVTISETDRLRVSVYPDQETASLIHVGDRAEVSDATRPEVKFSARVSRTNGELDTKTRTLLAEIDLDNREGRILAGSFVQVRLFVRIPPHVEIPAQALVIHGDKTFVGVVTPENRVTLRSVDIQESDGKTVRLRSGLDGGERVALHLGYSVEDGEHVQPVSAGADKPGS